MNDVGDAFRFIGDNPSLLLHSAGHQLVVAAIALVISLAIAVPLGVWLGHRHRGAFIAINVSNIGRALPSLALIAMLIAVIGIGDVPLVIALVVLAVPPVLTNAFVAIDGVDRDVVDAARGMGMSEAEIVRQVEFPLGIPLLFAGIRTAAVYVVATVPLGAVTGAGGGLGDIIANQASYRLSGVIGAAICVAVLALLVDLVFVGLQYAVTPRALRRPGQGPELDPTLTNVSIASIDRSSEP